MSNFEICFICRFPTTDFERIHGGEFWCGLCLAEKAENDAKWEAESDAVYYALAEHWEEDMKELLDDVSGS